jgi:hypothetical protein
MQNTTTGLKPALIFELYAALRRRSSTVVLEFTVVHAILLP